MVGREALEKDADRPIALIDSKRLALRQMLEE